MTHALIYRCGWSPINYNSGQSRGQQFLTKSPNQHTGTEYSSKVFTYNYLQGDTHFLSADRDTDFLLSIDRDTDFLLSTDRDTHFLLSTDRDTDFLLSTSFDNF